jgi:hypothetical protein
MIYPAYEDKELALLFLKNSKDEWMVIKSRVYRTGSSGVMVINPHSQMRR